MHDFDLERSRIDLSLLLNDYPPSFISQHFQRFFQLNKANAVIHRLDEEAYSRLHHQLLHQLSRREKQLQTMIHNHDKVPTALTTEPWNKKLMYPKFIFESAPIRNLKPLFLKW